jgi:hypothetical protein
MPQGRGFVSKNCGFLQLFRRPLHFDKWRVVGIVTDEMLGNIAAPLADGLGG